MANELAVSYKANDGTDVQLDMQTVQKYVLTGSGTATDAEVAGFLAVCKARGLNPMARDAYLVKYGNSPAATITSKDYFVRTANEDPDFDGFKAGIVLAKPDGLEYREGSLKGRSEELAGGWAEVYSRARKVPVRAEVALDEYNTGKSLWASKPATMIRKVALVQALREAFPAKFGGLYDSAEVQPQPVAAQDAMQQPAPAKQPQTKPQPQQAPRLTQEQAGDLLELCSEASQACGRPIDEVKAAVWRAVPWSGGDWGAYMQAARRAAVDFVEAHYTEEGEPEAEEVPYEP